MTDHNMTFIGKRSKKLAKNVLQRRIAGTVHRCSQNGYISYKNFEKVLFYLKLNKVCGTTDADNYHDELDEYEREVFTSMGKI